MVERTGPIRDDIEATRASMTDKMERIEGQVRDKVDSTVSQAKQAFDLGHQVNERPWVSLGAALTLGFVVGSMGGDDRSSHYQSTSYPSQPGQPMPYYQQQGGWRNEDRPAERQAYDSRQYDRGHESHRGQISGAMSQLADPMREELSLMAVAAVRSAMRVLRESLQDSIPQFDTEYRAVQHEREDEHEHENEQHGERAVGASSATGRPNEGAFRARQG